MPKNRITFGDNLTKVDTTSSDLVDLQIANSVFKVPMTVLPHQIFPVTLGSDWLLKEGAIIDFKEKSLLLRDAIKISWLYSRFTNNHPNNPVPHLLVQMIYSFQ